MSNYTKPITGSSPKYLLCGNERIERGEYVTQKKVAITVILIQSRIEMCWRQQITRLRIVSDKQ